MRIGLFAVAGAATLACSAGTGPSSGTVSGTVTSSRGGGLTGLKVTVTPSDGVPAATVTTSAGGAYSVTGVPARAGEVVVTGQSNLCSAPPPAQYTLKGGGRAIANVTVPCTEPVGTVAGAVTNTLNFPLPIVGATVIVTPSGQRALRVTTNSGGGFRLDSVPIPTINATAGTGSGTVTVGAPLPAGCASPATPTTYSGLKPDSAVGVSIVLQCLGGTLTLAVTGVPIGGGVLNGPDGSPIVIAEFGSRTLTSVQPGSYLLGVPNFHFAFDSILGVSATAVVTGNPAIVTPGHSSTIALDWVERPGTGQLWLTSPSGAKAYTPTEIAQSGTGSGRAIPVAGGAGAVAFDTVGNLWLTSGSSVLEFAAATLPLRTGVFSPPSTPTRALTLPGASAAATGVAFDEQGNLWVADVGLSRLVEYAASDLATSGTIAPRVIIASTGPPATGPRLLAPFRLAFDHGNLWVADTLAHCVLMYTAAQLGASGAPTPSALSTTAALPGGGPYAVAFDISDFLYAGGMSAEGPPGEDSALVAVYAQGGSTPLFMLRMPGATFPPGTRPASVPVRDIVMDESFGVWILANNHLAYFTNAASHLGGGPTIVAAVNGETGLAFDVAPPGLPLFGSAARVTGRQGPVSIRAKRSSQRQSRSTEIEGERRR